MQIPFVFGLACLGLVAVLLGYRTVPAASQQRAAAATVVMVTAGKPSEFAFKLSKSSALPWQAKTPFGTVTFKVTNRGALSHQFKVCTTPLTSAKLNNCNGTGTKLLKPGQSTTLMITFKKRGTYEYLSSVPGQAAKGMKGLIGIGVAFPKATTTTTTATTTSKTTTTPSTTTPSTTTPSTTTPTSPGLTGAAAAGAAVFQNGCSSCHTLAEVKAAGTIGSQLNSTHSGGPFSNGPLTPTQISDLNAYLSS